MISTLRTAILVFVVLSMWLTTASAQSVTYYRVHPSPSGARSLAFSEASSADNRDLNAMYSNPASLVFVRIPTIVVNHAIERASNVMNENVAIPLMLHGKEAVAIGLTVNHVGYALSGHVAPFKVIQYGYDVAYAREVIPTFSLGGGLAVRYAKSEASNLWGVFSTIGLFYSPSEEISYGAVFTGLGSGIRYTYDGVSTTLASENIPRTLQMGATLRYPGSQKADIVVASFANEKIFGEDGVRYKGGLEIIPYHFLALRMGYFVDPDVSVPTFGVGIKVTRWYLDAAIQPSKLTNQFYQISVAYALVQ